VIVDAEPLGVYCTVAFCIKPEGAMTLEPSVEPDVRKPCAHMGSVAEAHSPQCAG